MKVHRVRILFLILLLLPCRVLAVDYSAPIEEFRRFAANQMAEDKIPGMSFGFTTWADGEEKTWVEGFGFSDLENRVPAKADSAYRLGSVSKPMTALAVLLLAEQGKIDLDAEVQTYVPYFPRKKWPVTVRELLGHLGGISHYKDYTVEGTIREYKNTQEAIAIFGEWDLVAEPGTKYVYSSYGYNLLGAVVEGASGMPFGEFMRKNVWDPLGMAATRLDDPTDLIQNRVRGYRLLNGEIKNSEYVNISSRLGAGGARSTVPDLLKFGKAMLQNRMLSERSRDLIFVSMSTKEGEETGYSSGWVIRPANGHYTISHTGSQQETATALFCFPAFKLVIACAINQEDAGASIFVRRFFELLTGERWGLSAYVQPQQQQRTYRVLDAIFSSGLSYFELNNKPVNSSAGDLKSSFAELRNILTAPDRTTNLKSHTAVILGSYIADQLMKKKGASGMKKYHELGAIPFISDYLDGCKEYCNFPKSFRQLIKDWNQSWLSSSTPEIRNARIDADTDLVATAALLRSTFKAKSAYPDFSREFGDLTWDFLLQGQKVQSLQAGVLGTELYPDSPRFLAIYGIALAAGNDRARAVETLRKAYQLDPSSPAEPEWLADFAQELARAGKIEQARNVLQAGTELHPDAPNLSEALSKLNSNH